VKVFLFYSYRKEKKEARKVVSQRGRSKNKDLSLTEAKTQENKRNRINCHFFWILIISIKIWASNLTNW